MIHQFRKKKAEKEIQILQTVVIWFDDRLRRFAAYLSRKTEHLPPRRTAAIIIVSCLFFSICLGFAVFKTTKDGSKIYAPAIPCASRQNVPGSSCG